MLGLFFFCQSVCLSVGLSVFLFFFLHFIQRSPLVPNDELLTSDDGMVLWKYMVLLFSRHIQGLVSSG